MFMNGVLSILGYMFGGSGPEPVAVWRCELTRDEARLPLAEREDSNGRAARGAVPQSAPAANCFPQRKRSWCLW